MQLKIPAVLTPAVHFASTVRTDLRARAFWRAARRGRRFDARLPVALAAWARRHEIDLGERRLLLVTMTGFRRPLIKRCGWLMVALAVLVWSLVAVRFKLEPRRRDPMLLIFGAPSPPPAWPRIPGLNGQGTREVPTHLLPLLPTAPQEMPAVPLDGPGTAEPARRPSPLQRPWGA